MSLNYFLVILRKAIHIYRKFGMLALIKGIHFKVLVLLNRVRKSLYDFFQKKLVTYPNKSSVSSKKLVIFSGVPYDDVGGGQRSAQLARCALRTGMNVLYIYVFPKFDFNRQTNVFSKVKKPRLIHKSIQELNQKYFLEFANPSTTTVLFEFPHPAFQPYLRMAKIRGIRTVFELIDDWATSLGENWFDQRVLDEYIRDCDEVFGTANVLVDQLRKSGRQDAVYLPNAANEYIFDLNKNYERPPDLPKSPIALYFGSLYGEWFAWEYIRLAALKNSEVHFCLIGSVPSNEKIKKMPSNVHFLGEKKIGQLPAYLSSADFCLLPFLPSDLVRAVSPIKAFEYIFMGKSVVSTDLVELRGYPSVHFANSSEEFAALCSTKIGEENLQKKTEIETFIAKNSWFSRLQRLVAIKGDNNISVIILIHNNRQIIGRCLDSMIEHGSSFVCEIIVVDNLSQDDGADFVEQKYPRVRLVRNPVNGCSSGRNLGAAHARGKYLAFFDSDQWLTSGLCFAEAISILENNSLIGAVGWSGGWFYSNNDLGGPIVDYLPNRGMDHNEAVSLGYRTDVGYLSTAGMFVPRSIFQAAGGFDPAYDPTTFEDTDFSFSVKKLGFQLAYRDLSGIRHQAHQTTRASEGSHQYNQLFLRNSAYFKSKWKSHPAYFRSLKP